MAGPVATRHLGLDLGATNLKVTVVEHLGDTWTATSLTIAPAVRYNHVAVWTGS